RTPHRSCEQATPPRPKCKAARWQTMRSFLCFPLPFQIFGGVSLFQQERRDGSRDVSVHHKIYLHFAHDAGASISTPLLAQLPVRRNFKGDRSRDWKSLAEDAHLDLSLGGDATPGPVYVDDSKEVALQKLEAHLAGSERLLGAVIRRTTPLGVLGVPGRLR